MPLRHRLAIALASAVGASALLAGPAGAVGLEAVRPDPSVWATVNVCDTVGHPDGMGVRGAMPGTGDRRDELFMRFELQFRRADGTWRDVARGGDSGFIDVGNGGARVRQAGRTFTLSPPGSGQSAYVLRGLVTYEWRRADTVSRRARRVTTGGHDDTPGADPSNFSAPTCSIR